MSEEKKHSITVYAGPVGWFSCWMFTIGFAHLSVGKAILALVIWPYFVGLNAFQ